MSDTTPVQVTVAPLTRAFGKGRLKFVTVVEVEIAGLTITIQGVQITEDRHGHLRVELPTTRHPSNGMAYPAISVPIELHRCIERSVLELVPGSRCIVVEPEPAP